MSEMAVKAVPIRDPAFKADLQTHYFGLTWHPWQLVHLGSVENVLSRSRLYRAVCVAQVLKGRRNPVDEPNEITIYWQILGEIECTT